MLLKLLYHNFVNKSRHSLAYHPQLVAVYHQPKGLDIIIAEAIQPAAMIYTLKRDDMPSLSQWIKKEVTFVYQKFLFCLSKPQAWHIIAARSTVHIISPFGAVSHHALACIFPAA